MTRQYVQCIKTFLSLEIIMLSCFVLCRPANATTRYVRHPTTWVGGTSPFDAWDNAATNIQQAINDTPSGGTVVVSNGVYTNGQTISVTKPLTLKSAGGAGVTAIAGEDAYTCLHVNGNNSNVVDGFTLQHGFTNSSAGAGGVWMRYGLMKNCVVSNNHGASGYGGMYLRDAVMTNCVVIHNRGGGGGCAGVYLYYSVMFNCSVIANTNDNSASLHAGGGVRMYASHIWDSDIIANVSTGTASVYALGAGVFARVADACAISGGTIRSNVAYGMGGGVYVYHPTTTFVVSNVFVADNITLGRGGGLHISDAVTDMHGCVVSNNTSYDGLGGGGIFVSGTAGVLIDSCEVIGNQTIGYTAGGIHVYDGGGTVISNCVILGNSAERFAAGIRLHGSNTVTHSRIESNTIVSVTGSSGAGIYVRPVYNTTAMPAGVIPRIEYCVIVGNSIPNTEWTSGAGVYAGPMVEIRQCLIFGNEALNAIAGSQKWGGGIYLTSNCVVRSCTVVSNTAHVGGGLFLGGADNVVENNIFYYNHVAGTSPDVRVVAGNTLQYNCASDPVVGDGNITEAPLFVDLDNDNYRLRTGSPGINAGQNQAWMTDAVDLDGRQRIDRFSGTVDMGCYEYKSAGAFFYAY